MAPVICTAASRQMADPGVNSWRAGGFGAAGGSSQLASSPTKRKMHLTA